MKRIHKITKVILSIIGIVLLYLMIASQYVGTYESRIQVYRMPGTLAIALNEVSLHEKMERSWVNTSDNVRIIFMPSWTFYMVQPWSLYTKRKSLALPYTNIIFLRDDIAHISLRTLEGMMAREITYVDRWNLYGWHNMQFPAWKTEGLADYVSHESDISSHQFNDILLRYKKNESLTDEESRVIYRLQFTESMRHHVMNILLTDSNINKPF